MEYQEVKCKNCGSWCLRRPWWRAGQQLHRRPETRRDGYNTRGLCGSRRQTGRDVSKPGQYRGHEERAGERLDGGYPEVGAEVIV